ncbi:uroporphyrinogen decarboxylase [Nakamurella sp. A5-74]|uniref:Uroporphyrinogen decarboxylase n=1 Tax=Nakamurella sp. A5-74 TaxID=3158264 RepID=A0AAU8DUV6_9ACTN
MDGRTAGSSLVRAFRGERTRERAVWFMRQAGRSLPEYRSLRAGTAMLDACLDPEMASEITLQPVRRHGVDAAVFFSDIVVPLKLAGIDVEIVPGTGPVVAEPLRSRAQIEALPTLDPAALTPISEAVARCVAVLGSTPLVGFAGAPFTVASYLVEGGPSKEHLITKAMMLGDPETWTLLTDWVASVTGAFLRAQAIAGASALQLFDSWAGHLSEQQYRAGAQGPSAQVLDLVSDLPQPKVHFGVGTSELLIAMREAGADVIGVDHRLPLDEASRRLGGSTPLQGNIDPAALFTDPDTRARHVRQVLDAGASAPGHVVNLGHGVPPSTDPEVLTRLVELVHSLPDPAA